jgi:hypothetical protein
MPDNNQQIDKLVCGNYCITTDELYSTPPTHKGSVMVITEELGCSKICAWWVPQMLTDAHREQGKARHWPFAPTWYKRWGLPAAVCHRGRNLVYQFKPKYKWQSLEWCHMAFPRKEKL